MYRFALLTVLSCVVLVQADDSWKDLMENCGRLAHPRGLECCNKKYISAGIMEDLKECMLLPGKPPSCERELCIAKKKGFASDDGTIDKAGFKAAISTMDDKALQDNIIEDCLDGDISNMGPEDFCDLKKLQTCVHLHLVVDCPGWSNEGPCTGSAETAEKCIKMLD